MRGAGLTKRVIGALVAATAALLAPLLSTSALADAPLAAGSCVGANVPVTALLVTAEMHGTLCTPPSGSTSTVMVLMPGATYNHNYWDFPYQPERYNFRRAMNAAGYATFVVDRIGSGLSSHPLSALVTSIGQSQALHGVVQALRAGQIGGIRYTKVVLGGHSLSSAVDIVEAGTYKDVDGLLLTGYTHLVNVVGVANLFLSFIPVPLDPVLGGDGWDIGYVTTRVGTRAGDFYAPATTDPKVVATDEATKDVWSPITEGVDGLGLGVALSYTVNLRAPVLIADGQSDGSICGTLATNCSSAEAFRAQEAPNFPAAAHLQTYLLPGSGHSVNLATDTGLYQQAVVSWANQYVGGAASSS